MSILGAIGGIIGSLIGGKSSSDAADKQADLQKQFAKQGIRWKVEDAKAAGIHPLYALGAQTHSYAPVSVGQPDYANMGQNLGGAIQAMVTPEEKGSAFEKSVQALTLEKMGLENQVLASQLRLVNQPGRGPGMPGATLIPGQGSTRMRIGANDALSVTVNPNNTPAQEIEDQYGEAPGLVGGLGAYIDDWFRTHAGAASPAELGANLRKQLDQIIRPYVRNLPPLPRRYGGRGYGGY